MQPYIWLVWDLAAVAILALCITVCAKRGLIRTLVSFLSYVLSAVIARTLSLPLAKLVYEHIVRDILAAVLTQSVEDALAEGLNLLQTVPEGVQRIVESFLGEDLSAVQIPLDSAGVVDMLIEMALQDPVMLLLQWMSFLFIFSLALFVLQRICRLFTGVYRIPVLGTVNTVLGGVIGVAQGVAYLLVGSVLIQLLMLLSGSTLTWLNPQIMDATYIWRVFLQMTGTVLG